LALIRFGSTEPVVNDDLGTKAIPPRDTEASSRSPTLSRGGRAHDRGDRDL